MEEDLLLQKLDRGRDRGAVGHVGLARARARARARVRVRVRSRVRSRVRG